MTFFKLKSQTSLRVTNIMIEQNVIVSENGRIIIPAIFRKELNIKSGDELILRLSPDNEIIIHSPRQSLQKLQDFAVKKNKTNLVDVLIDMRRKENN
jgi:AbrB family looped-hinge helix DNA binding protein